MVDARNPTPPDTPANAEPEQSRPPLSGGRLAAAALLGFGVLGTVFVGMWFWINTTPATGEQKTATHLEVFKTTASVAVMLGGIGALYLAARRQRTQEAEHAHAVRIAEINRQHAERVAAANEDDAARRRVTELYTKAADQLGSDKAPVRLAGLYALERLGQDNPDQRQTIASLWCAYLRMPYNPPPPVITQRPGGISRPLLSNPRRRAGIQRPDPAPAAPPDPAPTHAEAVLERDVRLTVQRLLSIHLRPASGDSVQPHPDYWPQIPELDLTGATLFDIDMSRCHLPLLRMDRVSFAGAARFKGATFNGEAKFNGATFARGVGFVCATFIGDAEFADVTFANSTMFDDATFTGETKFDGSTFTGYASFSGAIFKGKTWFGGATFSGAAGFVRATFARNAWFGGVTFTGHAGFAGATFTGALEFGGGTFTRAVGFDDTTFTSPATCQGARVRPVDSHVTARIWPRCWTRIAAESQVDEGGQWDRLVPVPEVLDESGHWSDWMEV